MKGLLQQDKGVSPIIGYVLLIVLALGMAGAVYGFLKLYTPKDKVKCADDVSVSIQNISCSGGTLNIVLTNRGLFSFDGAYINIGEVGTLNKTTLNCLTTTSCNIYFGHELKPGDSWQATYGYNGTGNKEIEILPVMFVGGRNSTTSLCTQALIKREIECTTAAAAQTPPSPPGNGRPKSGPGL